MRKQLVVILFIAVFIAGWWFFLFKLQRSSDTPAEVAGVASEENTSSVEIRGIILPHHALVKSLISQSLERITNQQQYSLVVILGPNHWAAEKAPLVTASHLSEAKVATEVVENLLDQFPLARDSQQLIEKEHSIMIQLPYIKYYLPQAKVIPLIFSPTFGMDEAEKLANFLAKNTAADTLYLGSIDFSHQSSVLEGLDKNAETLTVLQNFDYKTLYQFGDEHLDSPVAAAVLLKAMQEIGTTNWETWYNTHAGIVMDDPRLRGTSYVVGVFKR